jgi:hypothetical protein
VVIATDLPEDVATSICRSSVTICSGLGLFFEMTKLLSKPVSIKLLGTYVERPRRQVLFSDASPRWDGAVICTAFQRGF